MKRLSSFARRTAFDRLSSLARLLIPAALLLAPALATAADVGLPALSVTSTGGPGGGGQT